MRWPEGEFYSAEAIAQRHEAHKSRVRDEAQKRLDKRTDADSTASPSPTRRDMAWAAFAVWRADAWLLIVELINGPTPEPYIPPVREPRRWFFDSDDYQAGYGSQRDWRLPTPRDPK